MKYFFLFLALSLSCSGFGVAAPVSTVKAANLEQETLLDGLISVPGGNHTVFLSVQNESVRMVLHRLSEQGPFNLVMDDSVTGNVSIELGSVTLNQALQSVTALNDLLVLKQPGNIYLVITRQAALDKNLSRQLSKVIPVHSVTATRLADLLNHSVFSTPDKVKPDPRTNSLVVVGTSQEIALAESAVMKLDVPRESKTFYLSHANALDVAGLLAGSLFNDGNAILKVGAAGSTGTTGGATGTTGTTALPSSMRIERQDIQEGTGINNFGGSAGGGSSGGGTGGLTNVTLRGTVKASDTLSVSPQGPLIIPDTRQNAITIMGTAEQIAMAEKLIPTLDAQLPQVAIEASLIEITSDGIKQLGGQLGSAGNKLQIGFNNQAVSGVGNTSGGTVAAGSGLIGLPTVDPNDNNSYGRSGILFTTNPLSAGHDYLYQLKALITESKAKVLANPTVVATHDKESIISIVDEIVRRVTTQIATTGFATQTIEIGDVGIILDILPKVGEDGTVSMRLRPSVSTILSETRDVNNNIITLLSRRDLLTQSVRIKDGETLVIGGLVEQRDQSRKDKLPVGGDLPIVGALMRASENTNKRSEIIVLITPHILNHTQPTPVNTLSAILPVPPVPDAADPPIQAVLQKTEGGK